MKNYDAPIHPLSIPAGWLPGETVSPYHYYIFHSDYNPPLLASGLIN